MTVVYNGNKLSNNGADQMTYVHPIGYEHLLGDLIEIYEDGEYGQQALIELDDGVYTCPLSQLIYV